MAPYRYTASKEKVLSNIRRGSFDYVSLMELIYQSNPKGLEPMVEYQPHARRDFLVKTWIKQEVVDKMAAYPSRRRASIVGMVKRSGALRLFRKGLILVPVNKFHSDGTRNHHHEKA